MANQMVALQARAPQGGGLGPAIAQGAQMINMMTQQRAAERQAAQAQQTLDIQAAQEARAAAMAGPQLEKAKADALAASLDVNAKQAQLVKRDLAVIRSGDLNAITNWRQRATQLLPEWAEILPSAEEIASDRNTQLTIASVIDQIINKEIASPVASLQLTPENQAVSVTVGGTRPGGELLNIGRGPAAPGAAPTAAPMAAPQMSQATPGTLNEVIDIALQTGVMSKTNFDKLLSIAQPESRAKIAGWVQSNNIEVVDEAAGGNAGMRMEPMSYDGRTPQSEFAVDRRGPMQSQVADLRSAPPMQQMMAQSGAGQPLIIKTPTPPGANVAPGILGSQKAAETAGSENVKVVTQPQIVAGEERVRRLEKLRGELPRALSETQVLVNNLTDRIKAIDDFLRSPYRNSIIGMVEGRIPRVLQTPRRADAQADYDYITSNTVLQKLIDDRAQTETGASPQGVVSDRDLQVAIQAATKLTQTGTERKQEVEMQRLRDVLYRTRELALKRYGDVYREVIKEAPELRLDVRPVAPKYTKVPSGTGATTKTKPKATPPRRVTPTGGWGKATVVGD
jgi:hypothetical protein